MAKPKEVFLLEIMVTWWDPFENHLSHKAWVVEGLFKSKRRARNLGKKSHHTVRVTKMEIL